MLENLKIFFHTLSQDVKWLKRRNLFFHKMNLDFILCNSFFQAFVVVGWFIAKTIPIVQNDNTSRLDVVATVTAFFIVIAIVRIIFNEENVTIRRNEENEPNRNIFTIESDL